MTKFIQRKMAGAKTAVVANKQTTICGIIAAALIVLQQVGFYFDDDPTTTVDLNAIGIAIVALYAGLSAKDGANGKDTQ